jgi:simple sugar transport system permease protein
LAVTGVFQGMLLFFLLACDVLIHYQIMKKTNHKQLIKEASDSAEISNSDIDQPLANAAAESK